MKKFNVISYTEYVCPCCGMKRVFDSKEDKIYCSKNHTIREMKRKYRSEVVR